MLYISIQQVKFVIAYNGVHNHLYNVFYLLTTVSFSQSTYSIDEDDGPFRPVLVVSHVFLTDVTVRVLSNDGSATGKYSSDNMYVRLGKPILL